MNKELLYTFLILTIFASCSSFYHKHNHDLRHTGRKVSGEEYTIKDTNSFYGLMGWLHKDDTHGRLPEEVEPKSFKATTINKKTIALGALNYRTVPKPLKERMEGTFESSAFNNVKERRLKWMHPLGVCGEVEWRMANHERDDLTGLFSPGAVASGLMRFSSGTMASSLEASKTEGRLFGFAVKLFPTNDLSSDSESVNLFTLDRFGFLRSKRPYFFQDDPDESSPLYFTNVGDPNPRGSLMNRATTNVGHHFFNKVDKPNAHRPLYPFASLNPDGTKVSKDSVVSPREIWFIPRVRPNYLSFVDFRHEIMSYEEGDIKFDIYLIKDHSQAKDDLPKNIVGKTFLGSVEMTSKPFMSLTCDLDLHFKHDRNIKPKRGRRRK